MPKPIATERLNNAVRILTELQTFLEEQTTLANNALVEDHFEDAKTILTTSMSRLRSDEGDADDQYPINLTTNEAPELPEETQLHLLKEAIFTLSLTMSELKKRAVASQRAQEEALLDEHAEEEAEAIQAADPFRNVLEHLQNDLRRLERSETQTMTLKTGALLTTKAQKTPELQKTILAVERLQTIIHDQKQQLQITEGAYTKALENKDFDTASRETVMAHSKCRDLRMASDKEIRSALAAFNHKFIFFSDDNTAAASRPDAINLIVSRAEILALESPLREILTQFNTLEEKISSASAAFRQETSSLVTQRPVEPPPEATVILEESLNQATTGTGVIRTATPIAVAVAVEESRPELDHEILPAINTEPVVLESQEAATIVLEKRPLATTATAEKAVEDALTARAQPIVQTAITTAIVELFVEEVIRVAVQEAVAIIKEAETLVAAKETGHSSFQEPAPVEIQLSSPSTAPALPEPRAAELDNAPQRVENPVNSAAPQSQEELEYQTILSALKTVSEENKKQTQSNKISFLDQVIKRVEEIKDAQAQPTAELTQALRKCFIVLHNQAQKAAATASLPAIPQVVPTAQLNNPQTDSTSVVTNVLPESVPSNEASLSVPPQPELTIAAADPILDQDASLALEPSVSVTVLDKDTSVLAPQLERTIATAAPVLDQDASLALEPSVSVTMLDKDTSVLVPQLDLTIAAAPTVVRDASLAPEPTVVVLDKDTSTSAPQAALSIATVKEVNAPVAPTVLSPIVAFQKEASLLSAEGKHTATVARAKAQVDALSTAPTAANIQKLHQSGINIQNHSCPKLKYLGLLMTAIAAAVATALGVSLVTVAAFSVVACAATLFAPCRAAASRETIKEAVQANTLTTP